ncbi:MAG: hypothetical protein ACD_73C00358G0002 [uncultured bacterium]|nr:MAG: hypothetical protein ACD_73C00358G0002 [uncultured bacterium]
MSKSIPNKPSQPPTINDTCPVQASLPRPSEIQLRREQGDGTIWADANGNGDLDIVEMNQLPADRLANFILGHVEENPAPTQLIHDKMSIAKFATGLTYLRIGLRNKLWEKLDKQNPEFAKRLFSEFAQNSPIDAVEDLARLKTMSGADIMMGYFSAIKDAACSLKIGAILVRTNHEIADSPLGLK